MKIAGIVAEYNPFHKGHEYHINMTRQKTGADAVAVIMSGNFVQRGENAICDKYIRAKSAIAGGADLVFELPIYYSMGVAQLFAFGAISTLDALGCIDFLSFGTEEDDICKLKLAAEKLVSCKEEIEAEIKKLIFSNTPYPTARSYVLANLFGIDEKILKTPNNMLAIEYMCALKKLNSSITPIGIKRMGCGYHDSDTDGLYPSATAIRDAIKSGEFNKNMVPEKVYDIYAQAKDEGLFPIIPSDFDNIVLSCLRLASPSVLENIIDMPHGFANRLISCAKKAVTTDELIELCTVKQYTRSRIRRLIFASLLCLENMGYDKPATYARVLAMNKCGMDALAEMQKCSSVPIITKTADYVQKDSDPVFAADVRASDIYALAYKNPSLRSGGKDFTTSPIIIK